MPAGFTVLENTRINGVFQGLLDPRVLAQTLAFSNRFQDVPAEDGEIMARFIGYVHIADLVADDQRAAVYSSGKFQFETANIPNIKVGSNATQAMLNQWLAIRQNNAISNNQVSTFFDMEARLMYNVKMGVAMRREVMLSAMLMDSMTYDRMGIKLTNASWGMPSDLKITPATPWTNAGSATPVDDILSTKLLARVRYGVEYDHVIMSTPAFRLMIATTEFQNKAKLVPVVNLLGSYTPFSLNNIQQQQQIAESITGVTFELYDARYTAQNAAGAYVLSPILDSNAVILTNKSFFNNNSIWDFANGTVTETVVAAMGQEPIAGGISRGPVAYATFPENLNPPNITYWAVQRGFPRKHFLQANACLRIGTVTDTISTAAPF